MPSSRTFWLITIPCTRSPIIARGLRGGYTRFLPTEDRLYMTGGHFTDAVTAALAGHAAEAVVLGEISNGASDDIERATAIVRKMVKECGMSDRVGPVAFGRKRQMVFLGRDIGEQKDYSEHVGEVIDDEIRRIIARAIQRGAFVGYAPELRDQRTHRGQIHGRKASIGSITRALSSVPRGLIWRHTPRRSQASDAARRR